MQQPKILPENNSAQQTHNVQQGELESPGKAKLVPVEEAEIVQKTEVMIQDKAETATQEELVHEDNIAQELDHVHDSMKEESVHKGDPSTKIDLVQVKKPNLASTDRTELPTWLQVPEGRSPKKAM